MMQLTDPNEIKLVEKFRESLEKAEIRKRTHGLEASSSVGRSWSVPSSIDSEEQINCSVSVSISSVLPRVSESEMKVEGVRAGIR